MRDDLSPQFQGKLGDLLRSNNYEIAPFLQTVFLSRDFYSPSSVGTHIKGPVELIVSTYRRLGLKATPGMPDFNSASTDLGQALLNPPTVAGWSQGRAWITPGSLARARQFRPRGAAAGRDRVHRSQSRPLSRAAPSLQRPHSCGRRHRHGFEDCGWGRRQGSSKQHVDRRSSNPSATPKQQSGMATANLLSEHEEFNTHYASLKGWDEAVRRVKPTPRGAAQFSLTTIVLERRRTFERGCGRLPRCALPVGPARSRGADPPPSPSLKAELGTSDLDRAKTYLEEPLRETAHLIMSTPEYQLA